MKSEPIIGNLQFSWSHPGRRDQDVGVKRDEYFVELVEHITAVTPEIDRAVGQSLTKSSLQSELGHDHGTPESNGDGADQGSSVRARSRAAGSSR